LEVNRAFLAFQSLQLTAIHKGSDDLAKIDKNGELKKLIAA
jgi:hypothetical protein